MAIYSLFSLTSGLVKLSTFLFYHRLSSLAVSPASRWTIRIIVFVVGGYRVACVFVPISMYRPISVF